MFVLGICEQILMNETSNYGWMVSSYIEGISLCCLLIEWFLMTKCSGNVLLQNVSVKAGMTYMVVSFIFFTLLFKKMTISKQPLNHLSQFLLAAIVILLIFNLLASIRFLWAVNKRLKNESNHPRLSQVI